MQHESLEHKTTKTVKSEGSPYGERWLYCSYFTESLYILP